MTGIVEDVGALKQIALSGAINGFVEVSSTDLGKRLGVSQQTASRRIRDLEKLGYIRREMGVHRQLVRVTRQGMRILENEHAEYERIFALKDRLHVTGTITSGLGEGAYYLGQPGYANQFREKLGFEAFPGTLNLQIQGAEVAKLRILKSTEPIEVAGFEADGRTFGGVDVWRAQVQGYDCAVILPRRTHHSKTLEIIARDNLRKKFGYEDGNPLDVVVALDGA